MSCRSYNWPSNETKEKSSVSVRLKNAISPFFAASMKFFSDAINVCSSGVRGLAGALACPAPATLSALQDRRIIRTTNPCFMPASRLSSIRLNLLTQFRPISRVFCGEWELWLFCYDRDLRTNPRGQLSTRNRNLLAGGQILQRKHIRRHFVLAHDQDVLRPDLRRRFKRLLQPEGVIAQLNDQIMPPQLAR